jgi:2'-hydroxyisoflavone reductase
MQKLLIIGGPNFIGRNLLEALEGNINFEITLFNRGKTNTDLFPQYKQIIGDRNTDDIQQIANQKWDYVVDLACYYPSSLEQVMKYINKDIKKYIFISTVSAYEPIENSTYEETAPLLACSIEQAIEKDIMPTYGQKKAECERILMKSGINYTILRPGLIYGAYDITDRFYYWMYQTYKRDTLLIPEQGDKLVSFTYVKDLAKAIIYALDSKNEFEKIYNTITHEMSIMEVVNHTKKALKKEINLYHAPLDFLEKEQVNYWSDLPMWLDADSTWSGKLFAKDFGHLFTNIEQSFEETIAHYASKNWPEIRLSGLKDDAYTTLLNKYLSTENL